VNADIRANTRQNAMKKTLLSTFVKGIAGLGLLLGLCDSAVALPITGTGKFTLNWLYAIPSTTQVLSAYADIEVTSWSDTELGLRFDPIKNTTVLQTGTENANILSIGLDFGPATKITKATLNMGEVFDGLTLDVNFPGGFNSTEVCVHAAKNCQGGDIKEGLDPGAEDTFSLLLTRAAAPSGQLRNAEVPAWDLLEAPVKFQTSMGSFEFSFDVCALNPANCTPSNRVPEPDSLSLVGALALSFGMTVLLRRRRRRN